jgi:Secretion system C-terminal sorting domain/Fibronectin type III domain
MKTPFTLILIFCTLMSLASSAQITITFYVDVTGQYVSPGGMHIAGEFATDGSTTITEDWLPNAPNSEMTLLGENRYYIAITFPESSAGEGLQFKFVRDSVWNDGTQEYDEGIFGTHLADSCGMDNGFGGINRYLLIPSSNARFNAYFDYCGTMNICFPPTTLTSNVTSTYALLNWGGANNAAKYTLRYRAKGSSAIVLQTTRATYTLNNLLPNTVYEWQIQTTCEFAPSVWSPIQTFTTLSSDRMAEANANKIMVYPNPASNTIFVQLPENISSVQIVNVFGSVLYADNINSSSKEIDIRSLPAGSYFIKASGPYLNQTIPFIIVK